jgi:hypothetical protein
VQMAAQHNKYTYTPREFFFRPYTFCSAPVQISPQTSGRVKDTNYGSRPPKDVCCWTSDLRHSLCARLQACSISYNNSAPWEHRCEKSRHISLTPQSRSSYRPSHVPLLSYELYRQSSAQCSYRRIGLVEFYCTNVTGSTQRSWASTRT